jgi:hypothetical protein
MALFVLTVCSEEHSNDFTRDSTPISGEFIEVDGLLGRPSNLIYIDGFLLMEDVYDGKALTLLDVETGRIVNRLLSVGGGPDEVLPGSGRMSYSQENRELYRFQIQSGDFYTYAVPAFGRAEEWIPERKSSVRLADRPANAVAMSEALVGIGPFEDGRYHVYDKNGTFVSAAGSYPFEGEKIDYIPRFFLYQGYFCAQPGGNRFAQGCSYSDHLEFYEIENGIRPIKQYGSTDVRASFGDNRIILDDNCLLGYKGSYATESYCYMLYSGRTYAENRRQKMWAKYIFVFDWNGRFVRSFVADKLIYSFCVDEKNEVIYGIGMHKEEYALMKFKI